jgi:hypothetical protein
LIDLDLFDPTGLLTFLWACQWNSVDLSLGLQMELFFCIQEKEAFSLAHARAKSSPNLSINLQNISLARPGSYPLLD